MAGERKFHVGVKAMIENDKGEVLLLLDSRQINKDWKAWDFPGGRMNDNEDFLKTLARELHEETGITEFHDPEFVTAILSTHEITLKDKSKVGLILIMYKVSVAQGTQVVLSEEHHEYRWVSKQELKELLEQARKYPKEFTDKL